ncbi:MAG: hypothetical protein N3F66_06970 [Spirochaetes bacterium]|nr:hypothetical protein [Spirochaetota bacterium]
MKLVSDSTKVIYLSMMIIFIIIVGLFWLDYIGLINIGKIYHHYISKEAPSVVDATDDEPSLIEREEFEKEKDKLLQRIEDLDKREAKIVEAEKIIAKEKEKLEQLQKGLDQEKKALELEKKKYSGYKKNVMDLAKKIESIPPQDAVDIMVQWEETLIIDVLRQIDQNAAKEGRMSISTYLLSLMPKDKASRVMYLMTQL